MTREEREEAIYQLERCIHNAKVSGDKYSHFELAIEALKAEPCEDVISRDDVYGILMRTYFRDECSYEEFKERLEHIPSVNPISKDYNTIYYTPQPKTGHWKYYQNDKGDWINECSVCGSDAGVGYQYPYCPNCGAKMEGKK